MIGIGIDTGGTCTDAVIFDTKSHKVLSQSKTLTTRQDLKVGILRPSADWTRISPATHPIFLFLPLWQPTPV